MAIEIEEVKFLRLDCCGPVPQDIQLQRGLQRHQVQRGQDYELDINLMYTAEEVDPVDPNLRPNARVNAIKFKTALPTLQGAAGENGGGLDTEVLIFDDKVYGLFLVNDGMLPQKVFPGEIAIRFDAIDSEVWITYTPLFGSLEEEAKAAGVKLLSGE